MTGWFLIRMSGGGMLYCFLPTSYFSRSYLQEGKREELSDSKVIVWEAIGQLNSCVNLPYVTTDVTGKCLKMSVDQDLHCICIWRDYRNMICYLIKAELSNVGWLVLQGCVLQRWWLRTEQLSWGRVCHWLIGAFIIIKLLKQQ